jgi:NAD(P)-dependent dehydrogenase (short-subunit alcohol dehydrogenase family)
VTGPSAAVAAPHSPDEQQRDLQNLREKNRVGIIIIMVLDFVRSAWAQIFPGAPAFTEKDVSDLTGKVIIVTGGNAGIGFELIKLLYGKGATIYIASRTKERAEASIEEITSGSSDSKKGAIKFLHLDLDDLATIKPAAEAFQSQESKLDLLWNNAGVGAAPVGTKTKQDIEKHMGVNCIAPLYFTELLLPQLHAAAKSAPKDSVRVIWTSSHMAETYSKKGGVDFKTLDKGAVTDSRFDYGASKAGNWLLAVEGARRWGPDGIISVVQNPGNLKTKIYDGQDKLTMFFINMILYPPKFGAYPMLYAGLSPDITSEKNGAYVIPWGHLQTLHPRPDIEAAIKNDKAAEKFWEWCEEKAKPYH